MLIRNTTIACIAFLCVFQIESIIAQKKIERPDRYLTWVHEGPSRSESGYLTYMSNDSIILSSSIMFDNTVSAGYTTRDVTQIRFRKKTSQGMGALIGIVGGGLLGYIAGASYEGDDYCGNKCLGVQKGTVTALSTIGFGLLGTTVGTLIGSRKKKYRLDGKMTHEQYEQIQQYVIPMTSNQ